MRYRYEWPRNTEPVNVRYRALSVEGRGHSRQLRFYDYSIFGNQNSEILGRFVAKIKVTADKSRIFSKIREKLDEMEKRLKTRLRFEPEPNGDKVRGRTVTMTCYVYEPADRTLSEFCAFKPD